jgi:hypothetical protein
MDHECEEASLRALAARVLVRFGVNSGPKRIVRIESALPRIADL